MYIPLVRVCRGCSKCIRLFSDVVIRACSSVCVVVFFSSSKNWCRSSWTCMASGDMRAAPNCLILKGIQSKSPPVGKSSGRLSSWNELAERINRFARCCCSIVLTVCLGNANDSPPSDMW